MTCDDAPLTATSSADAPALADAFAPAPASAPAERGVFITFEGGEGAGKTTHIRFLAETLRAHGREVVCLREPGGTDIGEKLRAVVLDPANDAMCDECELLIYEAARAQIVHQVIEPALARGAVVLCDRFFDSSVAYQACGRGLDRAFVDEANAFACQGLVPDRTILMVAPSAKDGLARATKHGHADRLEQAGDAFHARVNAGFMELAAREPERVRVVESASKKSETSHAVFAELIDVFPMLAEFIDDASFFAPLDVKRHAAPAASDVAANAAAAPAAPAAPESQAR